MNDEIPKEFKELAEIMNSAPPGFIIEFLSSTDTDDELLKEGLDAIEEFPEWIDEEEPKICKCGIDRRDCTYHRK